MTNSRTHKQEKEESSAMMLEEGNLHMNESAQGKSNQGHHEEKQESVTQHDKHTDNSNGKFNGDENNDDDDEDDTQRPGWILPAIVVAQFAGTSLWFAGNAVLADLVDEWGLAESSLSYLTSSVQFGFIVGTLFFAILNIADRFSPTKVFLISSLAGAITNAAIPIWNGSLGWLITMRFLTGISLAGIYPVGMKVASDWYGKGGLGMALGFLVGALAVGTGFPFLLRQIDQPWEGLLWETSALAMAGGLLVGCCVPDGPYRTPGVKWDPTVVYTLFEDPKFRGAAFGYFGHMWEVYAFWAWCPVVWEAYLVTTTSVSWDASVVTFAVIAAGGVGCVTGGLFSVRYGSAIVAFVSLTTSGLLCFLSPFLFMSRPAVMLSAYILWGMAVAADSPQFSSLVASTAPPRNKGTALTIVNCTGFAITIGSIQLLGIPLDEKYLFLLLTPGPLFGLWNMRRHVFGDGDSGVQQQKDVPESAEPTKMAD